MGPGGPEVRGGPKNQQVPKIRKSGALLRNRFFGNFSEEVAGAIFNPPFWGGPICTCCSFFHNSAFYTTILLSVSGEFPRPNFCTSGLKMQG